MLPLISMVSVSTSYSVDVDVFVYLVIDGVEWVMNIIIQTYDTNPIF